MNCSTEPLVQAVLLRVHPDPGGAFGDAYTWCCTVVLDGDLATLKGAMSAPPIDALTAIRRALREMGARRVKFERRRDRVRVVELELG